MSVYAGSKTTPNPTLEQLEELRKQAENGPHPKLAGLVLSAFSQHGGKRPGAGRKTGYRAPDRCPCQKMTAKRAKIRGHKCGG